MIRNRPAPETRAADIPAPLVEVAEISFSQVTMSVFTEGTVMPRTQSELVPEVAGRVIEVSPSLVSGGFFEEGDVLLQVSTRGIMNLAITRTRAAIALAELRLETERQEAAVAQQEWELLGSGRPTPLALQGTPDRRSTGGACVGPGHVGTGRVQRGAHGLARTLRRAGFVTSASTLASTLRLELRLPRCTRWMLPKFGCRFPIENWPTSTFRLPTGRTVLGPTHQRPPGDATFEFRRPGTRMDRQYRADRRRDRPGDADDPCHRTAWPILTHAAPTPIVRPWQSGCSSKRRSAASGPVRLLSCRAP